MQPWQPLQKLQSCLKVLHRARRSNGREAAAQDCRVVSEALGCEPEASNVCSIQPAQRMLQHLLHRKQAPLCTCAEHSTLWLLQGNAR